MTGDTPNALEGNPFEALRRFARRPVRRNEERCDLCGEEIGPDHRHLLNLARRQVLCACRACAILMDAPAAGGGARRLIPTRCLWLSDFDMTDLQWDSMQIPVKMAFICFSTPEQRVMAFYPSPLGPTESLLPLEAWDDLVSANPMLKEMEPDVEALLIDRSEDCREYYLLPIDECYKLVGLIRMHWTGFSGGPQVRQEIEGFLTTLKERAVRTGGSHA